MRKGSGRKGYEKGVSGASPSTTPYQAPHSSCHSHLPYQSISQTSQIRRVQEDMPYCNVTPMRNHHHREVQSLLASERLILVWRCRFEEGGASGILHQDRFFLLPQNLRNCRRDCNTLYRQSSLFDRVPHRLFSICH